MPIYTNVGGALKSSPPYIITITVYLKHILKYMLILTQATK